MTAKPEIREIRPAEFEALGQLMVRVYSQLSGFPDKDQQPEYYKMLANIGDLAKTPETKILVALSPNNKLLGGIVYIGNMKYYGSGGIATELVNTSGIRLLVVDKNSRGAGTGKALTIACMVLARERKHLEVVLHSTQAMKVAWSLYEKLGFKRSTELDFSQSKFPVSGFRLKLLD